MKPFPLSLQRRRFDGYMLPQEKKKHHNGGGWEGAMPKVKRPGGISLTLKQAQSDAARASAGRTLDAALAKAPIGGGRASRKARLQASSAARVAAAAAAAPPKLAASGALSSMLGALDELAAALPAKRATLPPKATAALAAALAFTAGAAARDPFAALAARVEKVREC